MITILGATGHVGRQVAELIKKTGQKVRLVTRNVEDLRPLVGRRAEAMAGDALDTEFLVKAFLGSDAVFTLIPPNSKADDYLDYADRIGGSIARALEIARVDHVVNLSSIGADMPAGTGPIAGLHRQEERLNAIRGLNVLHLRAGYFMENLLTNTEQIRTKGLNGTVLRRDLRIPMIATADIAAFAAERLLKRDFEGRVVRYLLGQRDVSMVEVTMAIGIRIGKPNLPYVEISYEEGEKGLAAAGFSPDVRRLYSEMSRAFNDGRIITRRAPENTTPTSFEEFCQRVFVPLYMGKKAA